MSKESKKEGFFKTILKSIKDFDQYEDFAIQSVSEGFKYLAKIVAIFCMIICIAYTYKIVGNMNHLYTGLKDKIPDFSYQEGTLNVESDSPIIIEDYGEMIGTLILDDTIQLEEVEEKYQTNINQYGSAVIFTNQNLVIYAPGVNGQAVYPYQNILSNTQIANFSKQDVINQIESMNIIYITFSIYIMIFVYLFIIYFVSIAIDVFILALLAYIVGRFSGIKLKLAPAFNIAVHSITLPILLNLIYIVVNLLTGFTIKYFQLMYNAISYIYVIVAILMIKTDLLNRQAELIKLAQEQMKIKEELQNQEEEEKRKQEENKDTGKENENSPETKDNTLDQPIGNEDNIPKKESDKKKKNNTKRSKKEKSSDEPLGDTSFKINE